MTGIEKILVASSKDTTLNLKHGQLGMPGMKYTLFLEPQFVDQRHAGWDTDVTPRKFKVACLLVKNPTVPVAFNFDFDESMGSSYIQAPDKAAGFRMGSTEGELQGSLNSENELSILSYETIAPIHQVARDKFLRIACSIFDHISYELNIPVHIGLLKAEDVLHGIRYLEYTAPFQSMMLTNAGRSLHNEMAPIYALYREFINSFSDYYKLLCLYKILEGVFRELRPAIRKEAERHGVKLAKRNEKVPHLGGLDAPLRLYVSKSITAFFNNFLTDAYRDAVAHFTLRESGTLNISNPDTARRFALALPLTELCVRIVVTNHEADIAQVQSAGR